MLQIFINTVEPGRGWYVEKLGHAYQFLKANNLSNVSERPERPSTQGDDALCYLELWSPVYAIRL